MDNTKLEFFVQKEVKILKYRQPSISTYFQNLNYELFFTSESVPPIFKQLALNNYTQIKYLPNYQNTNLKLIALKVLELAFIHPTGSPILRKLKHHAYDETLSIAFIDRNDIPEQYRKNYSDRAFRKVLVQFFNIVSTRNQENKVYKFIQKHPFLNIIFVLLIRNILRKLRITDSQSYHTWLPTSQIAPVLFRQLEVPYTRISHQVYKFFNNSYLAEDTENIYISMENHECQNKIEQQQISSSCVSVNQETIIYNEDFKFDQQFKEDNGIRYYNNKNKQSERTNQQSTRSIINSRNFNNNNNQQFRKKPEQENKIFSTTPSKTSLTNSRHSFGYLPISRNSPSRPLLTQIQPQTRFRMSQVHRMKESNFSYPRLSYDPTNKIPQYKIQQILAKSNHLIERINKFKKIQQNKAIPNANIQYNQNRHFDTRSSELPSNILLNTSLHDSGLKNYQQHINTTLGYIIPGPSFQKPTGVKPKMILPTQQSYPIIATKQFYGHQTPKQSMNSNFVQFVPQRPSIRNIPPKKSHPQINFNYQTSQPDIYKKPLTSQINQLQYQPKTRRLMNTRAIPIQTSQKTAYIPNQYSHMQNNYTRTNH